LEAVEAWVRTVVEVDEWAGGDEGFTAAFAAGEEEWGVGDLFGENVYAAVSPGNLFESAAEGWRVAGGFVAGEPFHDGRAERTLERGSVGGCNV